MRFAAVRSSHVLFRVPVRQFPLRSWSVKSEGPAEEPPAGPMTLKEKISMYAELGKPRLSSLVIITTMFGYSVAPGPFELVPFVGSAVGTMALAMAAGAANQVFEYDLDGKMQRTRGRPVPSGRVSFESAANFGYGMTILGATILSVSTPPLCAVLGLLNVALYATVYTPLKTRSPLNTPVGALVGAIPPLIGWAACTHELSLGSVPLAILLYAWQMPHFHGLSYSLRKDYAAAHYKMLVLTHPHRVPWNVALHTLAMAPLGAFFAYANVTDWSFAVTSLLPLAWFGKDVWAFTAEPGDKNARKVFLSSLRFLPLYLLLLLGHHLYYEYTTKRSTSKPTTTEKLTQ